MTMLDLTPLRRAAEAILFAKQDISPEMAAARDNYMLQAAQLPPLLDIAEEAVDIVQQARLLAMFEMFDLEIVLNENRLDDFTVVDDQGRVRGINLEPLHEMADKTGFRIALNRSFRSKDELRDLADRVREIFDKLTG